MIDTLDRIAGKVIPLRATFLEWYERWIDDVLAGGRGTGWFGDRVYPPGHPMNSPG